MTTRAGRPHLLHIAGNTGDNSLNADAVADLARRIGGLGAGLRHSIVGFDNAQIEVDRRVSVDFREGFPAIRGLPLPGRLNRIARAMAKYDLICTYDGGAMNAVMAHTIFSEALTLPPLIHHETGDHTPGFMRNMYRRFAFGRASGVVVSSERMEEAALVDWQQPIGRVKHIPQGISVGPYSKRPSPDTLPGIIKRTGENWWAR